MQPHRFPTVALAIVLALSACTAATAEQTGGRASAGASTTSPQSAAADCVLVGSVAPQPALALGISDLGDGTKRVINADGGYSVIVPAAWLITASLGGIAPLFGQTHVSSFDPRTVPTARPEAGTILPPEAGIHLDIELWSNPRRDSLDRYTEGVRIGGDQIGVLPGRRVTVDGRAAYRFTIQDERRFQPSSGPLIATRQTRAVWLVPTDRDDRLLVIVATPAESSLLWVVERAVDTLRMSAPATPAYGVTVQRSEILKPWLMGKDDPISGRRAEAKLMTYTEASAALNAPVSADPNAPRVVGLLRIDHDPEDLFWVVAVSGPGLPEGRGGPFGQPSRPPTAWILYAVSATGDRNASTGAQYASQGTWPPGFDALPDRCR